LTKKNKEKEIKREYSKEDVEEGDLKI